MNLVGSQSLLAGHTVIHVHCILLLLFYSTTCTHQIVLTQHPPPGLALCPAWLWMGHPTTSQPSSQPAVPYAIMRAWGQPLGLRPAPGSAPGPAPPGWASPWASLCGSFGPPQNHPILNFFHTGPTSPESEIRKCDISPLFAQSSLRNSAFNFFHTGLSSPDFNCNLRNSAFSQIDRQYPEMGRFCGTH